MIEWFDNNGNFEARENGKFIGLVSINPRGTWQAGKWTFTIHPIDGGIVGFSSFDTGSEAKTEFERVHGLNLTFDQMVKIRGK